MWQLALQSDELKGIDPVEVIIDDKSIALFRDGDNQARALKNMCSHRGVSLSLGKVINGCLTCPYHGLKFNGHGECVEVPSAAKDSKLPPQRIDSFQVHEAEGSIWVNFSEEVLDPPVWPLDNAQDYSYFELINELESSVPLILENFVDCSHTGFVHDGFFRGAPKKVITADIEGTTDGMKVETLGENDVDSILGRILLKKGESIRHIDEYIRPGIVKVTYEFGSKSIVTISNCVPVREGLTRVFTRVYLSKGFSIFTRPLLLILKNYTQKILLQDKVILEDQYKNLSRENIASPIRLESDAPIFALIRSMNKETRIKSTQARYKL